MIGRRSLPRRVADWWHLRRGRPEKVLARFDPLGGWDDAPGGAGVREPRRPHRPDLSGSAAVDRP